MPDKLPVDKLNRQEEISFLKSYLTKRYELKKNESFVLNINAQWGYGKTYFLKSMKQELEEEHKVIYFDAWKYDFTKEPLLAFIATMTEELSDYFDKKDKKAKAFFEVAFKSSLPLIIAILSKQLTGCTLDELEEFYEEEKEASVQPDDNTDDTKGEIKTSVSSLMSKATEIALKEHNSTRKSINNFVKNMKKLLEKIAENKKLPLFILIDELDRCRPNYAIELLENIKHLFDIPGIIFIVATDSKQLSHSINAVYGEKFASEKYLKRFFDQEYTLRESDKYEYCKYLFDKEIPNRDILLNPLNKKSKPDEDLYASLFKSYAEYFDLGLRDIKQCIGLLQTVMLTWDKEEKIHLAFLLFFVMLKQKSNEYFEKSIDEEVTYEFFELIENKKLINKKIIIEGLKYFNGNSHVYCTIEDLVLLYIEISLLESDEHTSYYNLRNRQNNSSELFNIVSSFSHVKDFGILLKNYPNLVLNAGQLK